MKQVGLNVASDPLMSLSYIGVKGALVLLVADDPGPHSSQTEQDTRVFGHFANIPVLDPATPLEAYELTKLAFELSHEFEIPVILRTTTRVSHSCGDVEVAVAEPEYRRSFPSVFPGFHSIRFRDREELGFLLQASQLFM